MDFKPRYVNLRIENQPHVLKHQTVEQWLESRLEHILSTPKDENEMLDTNQIWLVTWFPEETESFHPPLAVVAATLSRATELANRVANTGSIEPPPTPEQQIAELRDALNKAIAHAKWTHETLNELGYCIDGGKCHHQCRKYNNNKCSRQESCVPLSGSKLDRNWKLPGETKENE